MRSGRAVAVVQPLPGIGDMIWHLPHIRAIAAHLGHPVSLIAKPRSCADQIFAAEETIHDVLWLDRNPRGRRGGHDGGIGVLRAVAALRARRFDAIYLLHHSRTIALVAMLAGIPARFGYGYGMQRRLLNRPPFLPGGMLTLHPFQQASEWLRAAGIPMAETEPVLAVAAPVVDAVRRRIGGAPVAIGIGSSEPYKQWGAARYAALAEALAANGVPRMVLIGGMEEASLAAEIQSAAATAAITCAIGWTMQEVAALLSLSTYYVGNDTGAMNIAAAVGIRTYCLFGAVQPFRHASRIVAIMPPDGVSKADGMARIEVVQVLAAIEADRDAGGAPPGWLSRV